MRTGLDSPGLPILTYHSIDLSGSITSTSPECFVETMERFDAAGMRCIDLAEWIRAGRPVVENAFALTFDDGDASILEVVEVFPRLSLCATVFLVTDHVGGENDWLGQPHWVPRSRLLDWSEIADLGRLGISFGSHTCSHPDLTKLDRSSLEHELIDSSQAILRQMGTSPDLLAYPYGRNSERVRRLARSCYEAAFGTRLATASALDPIDDLPRVDAYYLLHSKLLEPLIEGEAERWLRWRNRLRTARSALKWGWTR